MVSKADNSADGRFSGTNKGCAVAHITPEAADGGPLAVVKDEDIIEVDIPNEKLNILISFKALQGRLDAWEAPQMKTEEGYLSIYSKIANSAHKSAALNYK
jgi:dihydroxy-acid dehydratase